MDHAANRAYVDMASNTVFSLTVAKSGGDNAIMTGALTLSGAPVQDLHAATKLYVDANAFPEAPPNTFPQGRVGLTQSWTAVLPLTGGIMLGPLQLAPQPPVVPNDATQNYYVDGAIADAIAGLPPAQGGLPLSGGIMTAALNFANQPNLGIQFQHGVGSIYAPNPTTLLLQRPIAGDIFLQDSTGQNRSPVLDQRLGDLRYAPIVQVEALQAQVAALQAEIATLRR
jgi:hypothetical protein